MEYTCVVCKQPIEESVMVESNGQHVHMGPCLDFLHEREMLTENTDSLDEIQLL
ncbi:hypothetical protein BI036_gp197 [Morganella phage vB_MmoM_MP1]|uniref:Uncharacterized protein n=1 Tax=Morganella phage vB_MmoM_MP1 TaxID=1852628 RepID=A0A192YBX8_9CAUD|nr:hypothetical protein BI036_gp197 [Morganella phage vB_MmoM_MP1]ANM46660.1 hypothetical protein MP1_gp0197 [Morganella phage vB_MmoM_MP1]